MSAVKTVVSALVVACLLAVSPSAEAAMLDVRVDVNDNTLQPPGWNLIADPGDTSTVHSLTDFNTGLATGWTLRVTDAFVDSGTNESPGSWSNPFAPWVVPTVLNDYAVLYTGADTKGQITLYGLDPTKAYQVELLSVRNISSSSEFLVNGLAGQVVDGPGTTTAWNAQVNGVGNQDFMRWSAVVANASGQIVLDVNVVSSYAFLNGMRILELPEPSSFAICLGLFVGGFGLLPLWRRGGRPPDRVSKPIQNR